MLYVKVPVIRTEADYEEALKQLEPLFHADPDTEEGYEAQALVRAINDYEEAHFRIEPAEPVEVIKYIMAQRGLRQVDLAPHMGGKNRVSEVLSGKRSLTIDMIRNLSKAFLIPVEALIKL
ncbi:MAG: helix-turn-helix domain-containing protein [Cytophagales bacterium]|nr:helix-turn-helix domain-containing protein [Cytophagales bacterium]